MAIAEKFMPLPCYQGQCYATVAPGDGNGAFNGFGQTTFRTTYNNANQIPAFPVQNPSRDFVPNGAYTGADTTQTDIVFYLLGSAHPAGINTVFGDGSVHSIKYGVEQPGFRLSPLIGAGNGTPS